ncbi:hypothetical protein [Pelosinus fermentans]|nr:hypothetical protein [Pelosinus fermentans]EIW21903.1 hypothetical protein FA11_0710 [Pelosinus fermentans A11]
MNGCQWLMLALIVGNHYYSIRREIAKADRLSGPKEKEQYRNLRLLGKE